MLYMLQLTCSVIKAIKFGLESLIFICVDISITIYVTQSNVFCKNKIKINCIFTLLRIRFY